MPETPLRLLVVVSQPNDPLLGEVLHEEVLAEIETAAAGARFAVSVLHDPTAESLYREIAALDEPPHLIHLLGHGSYDHDRGEGSFALSKPSRQGTDWVADRRLAEVLTHGSRPPRAVIVHACEGGVVEFPVSFAGLAPQLIRHGVQAVVAMQYAVTNETAIAFSTSVYRQLAKHVDLDIAAQQARWDISRIGAYPDPRLLGLPVVYRQTDHVLFSTTSPATTGGS